MFLLLTSEHISHFFTSVSIVHLEQVNISWDVISKNVEGQQSTKKRLKLIQFLKYKINRNGVVFLHFDNESKWKDNFQRDLFYLRGLPVSCGDLIGLFGFWISGS